MRLGTCLECVGSLSRVSGSCQDGAREFVSRRPKLSGRLLGAAEKLAESWEARREFTRTSLKVSRRSLGTRREIVGGRPSDSQQGMPGVTGLRE
ncbi:hypothetical protein B296_00021450 [Ensete ventricosum]|uniref:Uncharacterized protein n=1 Tax=Ensete ventricosum TaxID=4639 RepID=A0A426Y1E2_ENSVE|nr:hypothetical protein B296_00021450 [Ensete ventricosum]